MKEVSPEDAQILMQQYPPEDFSADFGFLSEVARKYPREESPSRLETYYTDRYRDGSYTSENCQRLVAAFNHFMRHLESYDVENVAVLGDDSSLITTNLVYAYWRLYMVHPLSDISKDFHPGILIELANQQHDFNNF